MRNQFLAPQGSDIVPKTLGSPHRVKQFLQHFVIPINLPYLQRIFHPLPVFGMRSHHFLQFVPIPVPIHRLIHHQDIVRQSIACHENHRMLIRPEDPVPKRTLSIFIMPFYLIYPTNIIIYLFSPPTCPNYRIPHVTSPSPSSSQNGDKKGKFLPNQQSLSATTRKAHKNQTPHFQHY